MSSLKNKEPSWEGLCRVDNLNVLQFVKDLHTYVHTFWSEASLRKL